MASKLAGLIKTAWAACTTLQRLVWGEGDQPSAPQPPAALSHEDVLVPLEDLAGRLQTLAQQVEG